MATGDHKKLDKISTSEILQKLKAVDDDNTEFFYLYVSTAGIERKRQKRRQLSSDQRTLKFLPLRSKDEESDESGEDDEDNDDNDQMEVDNVSTTENTSQPIAPSDGDTPVVQDTPGSSSLSKDKARKEAMNKVHTVVLPKVLSTGEWRKVYDKDMKLTYRALYFNIIKKYQGEDDNTYIQRVGKIRQTLVEEADKVKKEYDVNFKINSLLSKPFLYDELALVEQSVREGSTQKQPKQRLMYEYLSNK